MSENWIVYWRGPGWYAPAPAHAGSRIEYSFLSNDQESAPDTHMIGLGTPSWWESEWAGADGEKDREAHIRPGPELPGRKGEVEMESSIRERYIGEVADACYKQGRRDMAEELRKTLRVAGDDRVAIQDVRRVLAREVCRFDEKKGER